MVRRNVVCGACGMTQSFDGMVWCVRVCARVICVRIFGCVLVLLDRIDFCYFCTVLRVFFHSLRNLGGASRRDLPVAPFRWHTPSYTWNSCVHLQFAGSLERFRFPRSAPRKRLFKALRVLRRPAVIETCNTFSVPLGILVPHAKTLALLLLSDHKKKKVVPIIEIPGYGSTSAKLMCEKLKIKSCKEADKLKKAKEEVCVCVCVVCVVCVFVCCLCSLSFHESNFVCAIKLN